MTKFHPFGAATYNLGTSISSTDTTILLSSFLEPVTGTPYTMVLLNTDIAYGTIAPKTTSSEFISFTGITQNADGTATLIGVVRGLAKKYPFTTDSAYKLPHSGQTQFIISDAPQVFEKYLSIDNDETINGLITFAQPPVGINPGGQPDASTTVKGIGRVSVAPVAPTIPIFVGDNDTRVPTQGENDALVGDNTDIAVGTGNKFVTQTGLQHGAEFYAADSGATDVMVVTLSPIPTSYTAGMVLKVKANHTNTSTTPTINANALGAKTITKNGTAVLVAGDILINQVITLMYDGTQFQLQNPPALTPPLRVNYKNGTNNTWTMATASGTLNLAHGLGIIPKYIRITVYYSPSAGISISGTSSGTYNGTTTSCVFSSPNGGTQNAGLDNTNIVVAVSASSTPRQQLATVTFDATNIILAFVLSGTNGAETLNILWEAQG